MQNNISDINNVNFEDVTEYKDSHGINYVVIKNAVCFVPSNIFDCGQCFRFNKIGEQDYEGVAFSKYIRVFAKDSDIYIENATKTDFDLVWHKFFNFEIDYEKILRSFEKDDILLKAAAFCPGIRILHQDEFECLISFIISQNNNIPRIKKIVESLCYNFGDAVDYNGKRYYAFPSAKKIADAGIEKLDIIKSGFRSKYIYDAAVKVADGEINLDAPNHMAVNVGAEYLKQIKGVGPKVAACVMLYGYNKLDGFPIDVWVRRILDKYYPAAVSPDDIYKLFGKYAGVAQQYLFHYERIHGKNEKNEQ